MIPSLRPFALVVASLLGAACFGGGLLDQKDRAVAASPLAELVFAPAGPLVLDGLYESVDIQGDMALQWRKVYYLFFADGGYTAAALGEGDEHPEFTTLSGTWQVDRGLSLDGSEPLRLEIAGEHLRISADGGSLVLARRSFQ